MRNRMKTISDFRSEAAGLFIDLEDQRSAVGVNVDTGEVLLDEGSGPDRFQGAVLPVSARPAFLVTHAQQGSVDVHLAFGENRKDHLVGTSHQPRAALRWTAMANRAILQQSLREAWQAIRQRMPNNAEILTASLNVRGRGQQRSPMQARPVRMIALSPMLESGITDFEGWEQCEFTAGRPVRSPAQTFECRALVMDPSKAEPLRKDFLHSGVFREGELAGADSLRWLSTSDDYLGGITVNLQHQTPLARGSFFAILDDDAPICAGVVSRVL